MSNKKVSVKLSEDNVEIVQGLITSAHLKTQNGDWQGALRALTIVKNIHDETRIEQEEKPKEEESDD